MINPAKICDPPTTPEQLQFEMGTYAPRNHLCNSLWDQVANQQLPMALMPFAEKILHDKAQPQLIYQGDPHGQIQMRAGIYSTNRGGVVRDLLAGRRPGFTDVLTSKAKNEATYFLVRQTKTTELILEKPKERIFI